MGKLERFNKTLWLFKGEIELPHRPINLSSVPGKNREVEVELDRIYDKINL